MRNLFLHYKNIIFSTIAIVVLLMLFVLIHVFSETNISYDIDDMVINAEELYKTGEIDEAYYQLLIYCQERPNDSDAWIRLGDYAMEHDDTDRAYTYYKRATDCIKCEEYQLGETDKIKSFDNFTSVENIKIYPSAKYTQDMTLTFTSENLTPESSLIGKINGNEVNLLEDENYLSTDWFTVDDSKGHIYITGNINCAQWQFVDKDGYYIKYTDTSSFKNSSSVGFEYKSYSCAEIPEDAVKARVTYYDKKISTNTVSDNNIFVGYGSSLAGYTNFATQTYNIPDLKENQYIEYKSNKWYFYNGNNEEELNWPKINAKSFATIGIDGALCGMVDAKLKEKTVTAGDKSLQYGIKYSTTTSIASCERIGDASGMHFDYTVDNEWFFGTENDFDNAYPWCEMTLCNVKVDEYGNETITLEGDESFKTDGSNGNVMVRIPKFYTKRVVKDGYEYIWISGKQHDGYEIEPVFIQSDGSYADYVYMSAYFGAVQDEKIVSVANTYPVVQLEYGNILEYAENNGEGFDEMNFLMCSALQKLFIIETGTIDSSEIFAGDTYMYYQYDTKSYETSGYAATDAKNSNVIKIYNNYNTIKICEGSSITIFNGWNSYKNNDGTQREVLKIVTTDDYMEITFDGEPMNIVKHKTLISNIPAKTGKTDTIEYCTGTLKGTLGKVSFKYRNIENLYGSSLIMLDDDAYVQDGYFYYYTDDGSFNYVDYQLAEQTHDLSSYDNVNTKMCIKEMGYDEYNPTIMLPTVVGNGASVYGYYGDIWTYTDNYNPRYILYGGADDNEKVAGIFQMRAEISNYDSKLGFFSARIMYK